MKSNVTCGGCGHSLADHLQACPRCGWSLLIRQAEGSIRPSQPIAQSQVTPTYCDRPPLDLSLLRKRQPVTPLILGVSLIALLGALWPRSYIDLLNTPPATWLLDLVRLSDGVIPAQLALVGLLISHALLIIFAVNMRRVPGSVLIYYITTAIGLASCFLVLDVSYSVYFMLAGALLILLDCCWRGQIAEGVFLSLTAALGTLSYFVLLIVMVPTGIRE